MYTQLVVGLPGKLYGLTSEGGSADKGVLFEYEPASNDYRVLHHFNGANGAQPYGHLTEHNGQLYGLTSQGGVDNLGTIFQWVDSMDTLLVLKSFINNGSSSNYEGAYPKASLTSYNGKLYGLTSDGGINDTSSYYSVASNGVLFEFDPDSLSYEIKHSFLENNEAYPTSTLIVHNNKLYRTVAGEQSYRPYTNIQQRGAVFEWDPSTDYVTVKRGFHEFSNGNFVANSLTFLSNNNKLYGKVAQRGYLPGGIFSFEVNTGNLNFEKKVNQYYDLSNQGNLSIRNGLLYGLRTKYDYEAALVPSTEVFEFNPYNNNLNYVGPSIFLTNTLGNSITWYNNKAYYFIYNSDNLLALCEFTW